MPSFRIATYNIHKGYRAGNRSFVVDAIRTAVHALRPEIAFFQEVVGDDARLAPRMPSGVPPSQYEFLKSDSLIHASYGRNVIYPRGHYGNAILSSSFIETEENIDLSVDPYVARGALYASFRLPGLGDRRLHAACVHLGLIEGERRSQIRRLCDELARRAPPDEPLLVVGDFNDWRERSTQELKRELGLGEAFQDFYGHHVRTFPSWLPTLRLDRIYYRHLALKSCERPAGTPWNRLSDHLPLVADFDAF